MQYLLIIFIIVTMFSACQNKEKAISTYKDRGIPITLVNLNIATDTLPLKLTDIGKDLEVVRLETTDSSLFGNASYLIGKKYIVAFSSAYIILFDRNGKHIRNLAIQGRGPGEYIFIAGKTWTPDENRILAIDFGRNFIHSWSIPDGQYTKIPLAQKGAAYALTMLNDSILQVANMRNKQAKYKLYTQTLSGRFLGGVDNTGEEDARQIDFNNNLYNTGRQQYYRPHRTDSVFQVEQNSLHLKYRIPVTPEQQLRIVQISDNKLLASVYHVTGKTSKQTTVQGNRIGSVSFSGFRTFFLVDFPNEKIAHFQTIDNDYLGTNLPADKLSFQENGQFYIEYPASTLTTLIPEILKKTEIDNTVRQRVEKLQTELSEEDNPVLIVGAGNIANL